jgi:hypothetical protein
MVDEAAEAASECVYVYAFCDACNNDACGQKVMAGAVAEVVNVVIVLLARLTPQFLPLQAVRYPLAA